MQINMFVLWRQQTIENVRGKEINSVKFISLLLQQYLLVCWFVHFLLYENVCARGRAFKAIALGDYYNEGIIHIPYCFITRKQRQLVACASHSHSHSQQNLEHLTFFCFFPFTSFPLILLLWNFTHLNELCKWHANWYEMREKVYEFYAQNIYDHVTITF